MAYSRALYTGNGMSTTFPIPFNYLEQGHVHVFVEGLEADYTWINSSTISIIPAPLLGAQIQILRTSSPELRLTDFQGTAILTEEDLDFSANQNFFLAQEALDQQPLSDADALLLLAQCEAARDAAIAAAAGIAAGSYTTPQDFGAVADGVTDASTAVQAAIDHCRSTGRTLYVPAGTYLINSTVGSSGSNFTMFGDGVASHLKTNGNIPILTWTLNAPANNLSFRNMMFSSDDRIGKPSQVGIALEGSHAGFDGLNHFDDLTFYNIYTAMKINKVRPGYNDCGFDWSSFHNLNVYSCYDGIVFTNGSGTGSNFNAGRIVADHWGIAFIGASGAGMGNNVGDLVFDGIQFGACDVGIYVNPQSNYKERFAMTSCQFDAGVAQAVSMQGCMHISTRGCNWGGGIFFNLPSAQFLNIDGANSFSSNWGIETNLQSTSAHLLCIMYLPKDYDGVFLEITSHGYIPGVGGVVTHTPFTIINTVTGPVAKASITNQNPTSGLLHEFYYDGATTVFTLRSAGLTNVAHINTNVHVVGASYNISF